MNVPDEPSPVLEGMSAIETSSSPGSTAWRSSTARTIRCSISDTDVRRSSSEYLIR